MLSNTAATDLIPEHDDGMWGIESGSPFILRLHFGFWYSGV